MSLLQTIEQKIKILADSYSVKLKTQINKRMLEMEEDDKCHYLIYKVLGITTKEGELIDLYQNKGRFLYKYAGSFLEEATIYCFKEKFPEAQAKIRVKNILGSRPKTVEIDCLVNNIAYEIKWREATTDGDHITKEHTRVKVIEGYGYKPVRIMFYYPNRSQALKIQDALKTIYKGVNGEYYAGDEAWDAIKNLTDVDLKDILIKIVEENVEK